MTKTAVDRAPLYVVQADALYHAVRYLRAFGRQRQQYAEGMADSAQMAAAMLARVIGVTSFTLGSSLADGVHYSIRPGHPKQVLLIEYPTRSYRLGLPPADRKPVPSHVVLDFITELPTIVEYFCAAADA